MAGFMSGFGQAFSKAFESQTERLYQKEEADKQRAYAEKMAQIQRDWDLQMQEKRQAFEAKMEKDRQRWSDSRDATSWLQTRERDVEQRKQSLFDTGLARANAISDYKRGRADKAADTASEREFQTGIIKDTRAYETGVREKERKYASEESDRTATRDAGIREKQDERRYGHEERLLRLQDELNRNNDEREKKKLEDKQQREAVKMGYIFAKELGVPPGKMTETVQYLADKIISQGVKSVEEQVYSGKFKLTGIEEKTSPTNSNERSNQEMQRLQKESGMPTGMDIMTPEEALSKGIPYNPEQSVVFRRIEDDTLPDLQDLIHRRDVAQAAGNFSDYNKYSSQIRAVTAALAIKSNAKAVETGMEPMTVWSERDGYVTGIMLNDPENPGGMKLYSPDQKTPIDMNGKIIIPKEELELGQKIAKDMVGPVSDYQARLGSFAQTTAYVGQAYRIAEADPRVRSLAGTIAEKATGLVRDVASTSDLILNELKNTGKLSPEIEAQAFDLEKKMQELLTKDTLSLAENTALFKAFVTMSAFRAAALFDQKGRALSNLEYENFVKVNMGRGRPEILRQTYQGIYGIIANDLNVSRDNLLNNPQLANFREVYKRSVPGLEIESVEDTFKKYGEDAEYGYNLVTGNQTVQPMRSPVSQPLQFNSEEELLQAVKEGRIIEGDTVIGPGGKTIKNFRLPKEEGK